MKIKGRGFSVLPISVNAKKGGERFGWLAWIGPEWLDIEIALLERNAGYRLRENLPGLVERLGMNLVMMAVFAFMAAIALQRG